MPVTENHVSGWDSMSSHQKLSLGVFLVIGVASAVLWPFLIGKEISMPFKRTGTMVFKTAEQVQKEQDDKLRRMDTDGDGLSDYDELYVYHTSPFLADSDSDGIPDGVEVARGTDPNCPEGKTCRQARIAETTTAVDANSPVNGPVTMPSAPTSSNSVGGTDTGTGTQNAQSVADQQRYMQAISDTFGDPNKLTPQIIKDGLLKMSATDLRSFLGKLGIPTEALQKADDATLRKLVSDTLNEMVIQNDANAAAGTNAP